jgi:ABC-type transport system involved in multi-copper enzyme maturation permease subunit
MPSLIGFELRKIITRKSTFITALAVIALTVLFFCMNVFQQSYTDENGHDIAGVAAIAQHKENADALAGSITDERITADFREYRSYFKGSGDLKDEYVPGPKELDENGVPTEPLSEISRYENARYHYLQTFLAPWMVGWETPSNVIWRVDTESEIDYSEVVRQKIVDKLDNGMNGTWTYSQAERELWLSKYDAIPQPLEYGYAGGWSAILDCFSFLIFILVAICVGVTPVFASEYRERTDAIILASYHGKSKLLVAKVAAALLFAVGMMLIGLLIAIGIPLFVYGADGADLPVQLQAISVPYAATMWQAVLVMSGIAIVVALGLTAFILFLSAKWRSTLGIAMIGLALILLPLFISMPAYGIAIHLRILMPGMTLGFQEMFNSFVSYPLGPLVFDTQSVTVIIYAVMLVIFTLLAMRTFKRHQVL